MTKHDNEVSRAVATVSLLDTPVPENKGLLTPLTPSKYVSPSFLQSECNRVLNEWKTEVRTKLNSFRNWILGYIPPVTKKCVNEKLESLKKTVSDLYSKYDKK